MMPVPDNHQSWTPNTSLNPRCPGIRDNCTNSVGDHRVRRHTGPNAGSTEWLCGGCLAELFGVPASEIPGTDSKQEYERELPMRAFGEGRG